jgi:Spy/CpxP family protein refolding chaperone
MRRCLIVLGLILLAGQVRAFAQSDPDDVLIRRKLADVEKSLAQAQTPAPADLYRLGVVPNPKKKALTDALQTGLSGTWWREQYWIKELSLTPDQQKKMDEAFRQNKLKLIDLTAALEKEELMLEPLIENINPGDEAKIQASIDRVADARAGLEKANARMLLAIRQIMTQEQWDKVQTHRGSSFFKWSVTPQAK